MAKQGATILAETFGCDISDVLEYQYQPTRTKQAIYNLGADYYAVSVKPPKDFGMVFEPYEDQFFAEGTPRTIWVARNK